jgi:hypothetical protein
MTFREWLEKKAASYLTETVDHSGKTKEQAGYGALVGAQTRVMHIVHNHLSYEIDRVMTAAVKDANSQIALGIQEGIKLKLGELLAGLKCSVEVKK